MTKRAIQSAALRRGVKAESNKGMDPIHGLFEQQRNAFSDKADKVAVLCTRQAGKSFFSARLILNELRKPKTNIMYINETAPECRRVLWEHPDNGLPMMAEELGIPFSKNDTRMTMFTPWGSRVTLVGADTNGIDKLRGPNYDLVILDEAQKYPGLKYAIESVIEPALAKRLGRIYILGTPSKKTHDLFFDATCEKSVLYREDEWSVHKWSILDNIYIPEVSREKIRKKIEENPDDPEVLRELKGEWVIEDSDLVIDFYNAHPDSFIQHIEPSEDWNYVIGADLGYEDYFAYSILAWSPRRPEVWEVESFHETHVDADRQRSIIQDITTKYGATAWIDSAGGNSKATVISWQNRGLSVLPADKHMQTKEATYSDISSDLRNNRLRILTDGPLIEQMRSVKWLSSRTVTGRRIEDPKFENDVLDAFIYAYTQCRHFTYRKEDERPKDIIEAMVKQEEDRIKKIQSKTPRKDFRRPVMRPRSLKR